MIIKAPSQLSSWKNKLREKKLAEKELKASKGSRKRFSRK